MDAPALPKRPKIAARLSREIHARLRWLADAGGVKTYPAGAFWYFSIQAMLQLGVVTWQRQTTTHGHLAITPAGLLALTDYDDAERRRVHSPVAFTQFMPWARP